MFVLIINLFFRTSGSRDAIRSIYLESGRAGHCLALLVTALLHSAREASRQFDRQTGSYAGRQTGSYAGKQAGRQAVMQGDTVNPAG